MGYDETTYRHQSDDRGADTAGYRTNGFTAPDYRGRRRDFDTGVRPGDNLVEPAAARSSASDPGDPGRDRLGIHVGWEIVLLLGAAAIAYLLYRLDPAALRRPALDTLLISGTSLGLLTLGAGLTLRAGVPNLALGPVALAAALDFAENGDRGLIDAAVPAVAVAAVGGLIVGIVVVGLHVPGWAASLAAGFAVIVYDQLRTAPVAVQGDYDPSDHALWLFGGFALLAVIGGTIGTVTPIRRMMGRMRPVDDPARRRGAAVALPVIGSLVFSSVFAVVAGILMAAQAPGPVAPGTGLEWTGLALGTAMLAGTSAYGRRGGVFGTLLAVAGVTLFIDYSARRDLDIALAAIAACTLGAGLVVTRLVETYGRPLPLAGTEEEWQPDAAAGAATWSPGLPETWTSPDRTPNRADRWDDGPWGSGR